MSSYRALRLSGTLLSLGIACFSSHARAQSQSTCASNVDCSKGFSCEVVGGTACAAVACAPGEVCPTAPACTPQEIRGCVPALCNSDTDCGPDMVCHTETITNCVAVGAPSCAPGQDCGTPPPSANTGCTPQVVSQCMPRYLLGCSVATDCGSGFDCVPEQTCTCSGGSGTASPGSSGAAGGSPQFAPPPPVDPGFPVGTGGAPSTDPSCTCTDGPNKVCRIKDQPCTSNSDCLPTWTCSPVGGYSVCEGGTPASDPSVPAPLPAQAAPTPSCATVPGELKCVPPYYETYGGFSTSTPTRGSGTGGEVGTAGTPADTANIPTRSPFPSLPPSGATGQNPQAPTAPAGEPAASGAPEEPTAKGCELSLGTAPSGSLPLAALLGMSALLTRRRHRR